MQAADKWERKKRYLLRNFLVNPGFRLSPIPEMESSSSDADSGSLPDLVVEPEPNRHDDPPEFYEGLERRMKRYYRQLFLGENEMDDDDSSNFEVNQSMASTFMLNTDTRKDKEANITAEEYSITGNLDDSPKKRRLTKSTNESQNEDASESPDKYVDKLPININISADSKSSVEDPFLFESHSTNESNHSNKTDNDPNPCIEANGSTQSDEDKDNQSGSTNRDRVEKTGEALKENEDNYKIDSDSSETCHRISTTVAEIHEARAEKDPTHVSDNGSPVLTPRFSRRILGSSGVTRKSGQSFNVSEASDEFIKHDDNIEEQETEVQRLLTASELTRASLDSEKILDTENIVEYNDTEERNQEDGIEEPNNLSEIQTDNEEGEIDTDDNMEPIAQSSAKSIDDEEIEVMRDARETGGDQSWHGGTVQDSPTLAFETQADADKLENESSDSTEINTSFEEDKEERMDPRNVLRNIARILDEFWSVYPEDVDIELPTKRVSYGSNKRKTDSSGDAPDPRNTLRNIAKILDEFRSVYPEDVDIESPTKRVSYGSNKRKTDSSGDAPSTKRKKDIATQTRSEETHSKWEDIKTELFVGTPLVYRLCNCEDHVCS